jgi:hypothetical protein
MKKMKTMKGKKNMERKGEKQSMQEDLFWNLSLVFMIKSLFYLTSTLCILALFKNTIFASLQFKEEKLKTLTGLL